MMCNTFDWKYFFQILVFKPYIIIIIIIIPILQNSTRSNDCFNSKGTINYNSPTCVVSNVHLREGLTHTILIIYLQ